MSEDVAFRFALRQVVTIQPLNCPGTVRAQRRLTDGIDYRVSWWCDGKRCEDYLYEDELEVRK